METTNTEAPVESRKVFKTFWHGLAATIMILSVANPILWWSVTLWRSATKSYCSGECASGWYAVISTFLLLPSLLTGIIMWALATAAYNKKNRKL